MFGGFYRNDGNVQNDNLSLAQQLKQQMESDREKKRRIKEEEQSGLDRAGRWNRAVTWLSRASRPSTPFHAAEGPAAGFPEVLVLCEQTDADALSLCLPVFRSVFFVSLLSSLCPFPLCLCLSVSLLPPSLPLSLSHSSFLRGQQADTRDLLYVPGRRLVKEGRRGAGADPSAGEQPTFSLLPPMYLWRRDEARAVAAVDPKRAYAEELKEQMEQDRRRKQAEKLADRADRGYQLAEAQHPPHPPPPAFPAFPALPAARAPPTDFLTPFRFDWRGEEEKKIFRTPAPLGVKYLSRDPPAKFEERSRQQLEPQLDMRAPSAQQSRGMAKAAYAAELQAQIEEKKERERKRRQEERDYDVRIEKSIEGYDPWGRAGAGAPHRDEEGNVIADLRAKGLPAISGEKSLVAYDKFYGMENGRGAGGGGGGGEGWGGGGRGGGGGGGLGGGGRNEEQRRWSNSFEGREFEEEQEREQKNLKQQMLRRDLEEQIEEKKRQKERERLHEKQEQAKDEARLRRAGVRIPSSLALGDGDERLPAIEEEQGTAIIKTEDRFPGSQEGQEEREDDGEEEEGGMFKDFKLYKKTNLAEIRKLDTDEKYAKLQQELRVMEAVGRERC
eukprot:756059-Hanusia_phi.AAC.1